MKAFDDMMLKGIPESFRPKPDLSCALEHDWRCDHVINKLRLRDDDTQCICAMNWLAGAADFCSDYDIRVELEFVFANLVNRS